MLNIRPTPLLLLIVIFAAAAFGQKNDEMIPAVPTELATAAYPFVAIESGVSGDVRVEVDISTKGNVTAARVLSGPGFICPSAKSVAVDAIRNAAVEAAMRTKYKPAKLGKRSVPSTARLSFGFTPPARPTDRSESGEKVLGHFSAINSPPDRGTVNSGAIVLTSPVFPAAARTMKVYDTVRVRVLVETDGTVFSAEAIEGHYLLRAPSEAAACSSLFKPIKLSGQPVKISGIIKYDFTP